MRRRWSGMVSSLARWRGHPAFEKQVNADFTCYCSRRRKLPKDTRTEGLPNHLSADTDRGSYKDRSSCCTVDHSEGCEGMACVWVCFTQKYTEYNTGGWLVIVSSRLPRQNSLLSSCLRDCGEIWTTPNIFLQKHRERETQSRERFYQISTATATGWMKPCRERPCDFSNETEVKF